MLYSLREFRLFAALVIVGIAGCRPQEQIARYTVPKPELLNPVSSRPPAAAPVAQAILGAIIPAGEQSWFFKLTGEPQSVEPLREAFLTFVKSVKLGGDAKPSWELPEGWQELPGSQFRVATIQIPAGAAAAKPLEIAVSTAGGSLLDNINRWREQVSLPRIKEEDLPKTAEKFSAGEQEGTLVLLIGTGSGRGMGGGPFSAASGGSAPPALVPQKLAPQKADQAGIAYDVPPEWKPARPDAISVASFTTDEGDQKCKITVTSAGGDLLMNVNRWRGQVGLPPIEAADLASSVKKIETLGVSADYVELIGPGDVTKSRTILGVMAPVQGQTWFVKLTADSDLAAREKSRFEAFAKSLKFK